MRDDVDLGFEVHARAVAEGRAMTLMTRSKGSSVKAGDEPKPVCEVYREVVAT